MADRGFSETIEIGNQLRLALKALDALLPIAEEAGVETGPLDAYDEWETLVEAVFKAFVVIPYCDTTGLASPDDFHRLGFAIEAGKMFVSMDIAGERYALTDLEKGAAGAVKLCVAKTESLGKAEAVQVSVSQFENIGVTRL